MSTVDVTVGHAVSGTLSKHRWKLEPIVSAGFAVAAVMYGSGASFRQDYVVLICSYALIALGMYIPFIMGGSLSLAYNAYMGFGAYACAILSTTYDLPTLLGVPVAMVLSAVVAYILGLTTKRLRGFYLAGATLFFALAFEVFVLNQDGLTNGAMGMGVERPVLFGHHVDRLEIMITGVVIVWLITLAISRMRSSGFGVAVRLRKEVPEAVESAGVSTGDLSLFTLALGAAIAALGGALFGIMTGVAQPESFGLDIIFLAIFMPLLGGRVSPWGAVIGAAIVVIFTFELDFFAKTGTLVFALMILVILRFFPNGVLGIFRSSATGITRWIQRRGDA